MSIAKFREAARLATSPELFEAWFGRPGESFPANFENEKGFERIRLVPRVLTGASESQLSTTVGGLPVSLPVLISPTGGQLRFGSAGEIGCAKAAATSDTIFTLSMASHFTIEEVAEQAGGKLWFQLYYLKDRAINERLIRRVEDAGYKALVVTVDHVGNDSKERLARFHGGGSKLIPWRNLQSIVPTSSMPESGDYYEMVDMGIGWDDIKWLRSITMLPIVIKGVQSVADAKLCIDHGVEVVVVSNHGGHALGGVRATIDTAIDIVLAVGSEIEILVDGGVRSGEDVLKALACGVRAVMIGRAMVWGLAAGGEGGVSAVIETFRRELSRAMAASGLHDVNAVSRDLVHLPVRS